MQRDRLPLNADRGKSLLNAHKQRLEKLPTADDSDVPAGCHQELADLHQALSNMRLVGRHSAAVSR